MTYVEFVIVTMLTYGNKSGRDIRAGLGALGIKKRLVPFYSLMANMEKAGLVEGWYMGKVVEGHKIRERRYKLTPKGAVTQKLVCETEVKP